MREDIPAENRPKSDYLSWQPVECIPRQHRSLVIDDEEDFQKTWDNAQIKQAIIQNDRMNERFVLALILPLLTRHTFNESIRPLLIVNIYLNIF